MENKIFEEYWGIFLLSVDFMILFGILYLILSDWRRTTRTMISLVIEELICWRKGCKKGLSYTPYCYWFHGLKFWGMVDKIWSVSWAVFPFTIAGHCHTASTSFPEGKGDESGCWSSYHHSGLSFLVERRLWHHSITLGRYCGSGVRVLTKRMRFWLHLLCGHVYKSKAEFWVEFDQICSQRDRFLMPVLTTSIGRDIKEVDSSLCVFKLL